MNKANIGPVGSEGAMGIQAALGEDKMFYGAAVQIPRNAMRIRSDALRYEFEHNAGLPKRLMHYMSGLHLRVSQSASLA